MRACRRIVPGAALLVAMALVVAACGSGGDDENTPASGATTAQPKGELTVGTSFGAAEDQVVAEMWAQVLENAGYTVHRELDIGEREVGDQALASGEIDLKVEYLAYELPALDPSDDGTGTAEEVAPRLEAAAAAKGLVTFAYSPADSTNAFVMTKANAEQLGVSTMSDLAPVAGDLTLGAPAECPDAAFCIPGMKRVYGIEFGDFKALDYGSAAMKQALSAGAIDVALLGSLDPDLATEDWIVLEDDKHLQAAGNIVPLVRKEVATDELRGLLDPVTTSLTDESMIDMIGRIQNDQEDVGAVATEYLQSKGLI
jgi:osmoprotectant transport system substrate-binding protein